MSDAAARQALVAAARRLGASGLTQGTSGNVSLRVTEGLLITPSGLPYEDMAPEDAVVMGLDGVCASGQRKPSTEWRFHAGILAARPEAGAVVHCHSLFATTLACLRRGIPAFHYMIAVAGGDSIRCADYATFGTAALAGNARRALDGRRACLLANHGQIALGPDLDRALALAVEVETLASQYWHALQLGQPTILSAEEMRAVYEMFRGYGRQA